MMGPPLPCDCTCRCGDDPWLKTGRSAPCAYKQDLDAAADRMAAALHLQAQLGYAGDLLGAMQELQRLRSEARQ